MAEPLTEEGERDLVGKVVLGRHRIVRALARGGMGLIYLARTEGAAGFVKPCVVKRMLGEHADQSAVKMFKREARIMSLLRHNAIVPVTEFGLEQGDYLLVMDYVHGFHLGKWASFVQQTNRRPDGSAGQLPWQLATHIVIQVLEALEYAHTLRAPDGQPLNIIHRDVSPSNVLLDVEGRVFLADFGIAKSDGEEETRTTIGTVKGKFSYMAPEILEGHPPEPAGDVYATAVVLHEILVGRNEFRGHEPSVTIQRVLNHVPRRLDVVRPDVPAALADVVARALLKTPQDRFQTASEFARALRKVRGIDAEEANERLRKTLGRDFRDPRFAPMFDMPPLDELETAWRTVPDAAYEPISVPPLDDVSPAGPTEATEAARITPPPGGPVQQEGFSKAFVLGLFALFALLATGLVGAAIWALRPPVQVPPDAGAIEVLITGVDAGLGLAPDASSEVVVDDLTLPDAAVAPRQPTRPVDPAAVIDRHVQRALGRMQACFTGDSSGAAMRLRFTTDARGDVTRVELSPANIASSGPGRCVVGVAGGMDFGEAVGARTFSVPIEVR